jgi:predicted Fe-S protein YdhL (DUF1289 family)
MKSPCISLCKLINGVCQGCFRTSQEISHWSKMSNDQKEYILNRLKNFKKRV